MKHALSHTVADLLDKVAEQTGRVLAVMPLLLVLVQFAIVLMVYVFASGSIMAQESLQYINAMMFLGAAGYTLLHGGHVRVDLFYSKMTERNKAIVNLCGSVFLLIPFLILFWFTAIPYVVDSWSFMEGSVETGGLPFVYILKSTMLLFALTLSLQAVSLIIRSIHSIKGDR